MLHKKQERQCTRNVTLRVFAQSLLQWEISISYSECVFVALVIQHAKHRHHTAICGQSGSTIFFPHCLISGTIFGQNFIGHKMCVLILLDTKCVF